MLKSRRNFTEQTKPLVTNSPNIVLPHPLQGAFDRIDRAEERMTDLKLEIHAYGERYANAVTVWPDAQQAAGFRAIHPSAADTIIPTTISILVGEIIYNLRAALDYLVFELALLDSGREQKKTQFLICNRKDDFTEQWCSRLKGINEAHVAAIEALQPYRGCHWTRWLQEISNPDKHQRFTDRGSSATVEIVRPGYDYVALDPAQNLFRTEYRTKKGANGLEVDLKLLTSIIVGIPSKHAGKLFGQPVEELLQKILAGTRLAVESFKSDFGGVHATPSKA